MSPAGLNRPPDGTVTRKPVRTTSRECLECGEAFSTPASAPGVFCCVAHKRDFQNRRQQRGAQLYDLFMANRYDRPAAAAIREEHGKSLLTLMCRMAEDFRREDGEVRAGRRSWRDPRAVLGGHPYLFAVATDLRRK